MLVLCVKTAGVTVMEVFEFLKPTGREHYAATRQQAGVILATGAREF
jgi:hypothetical protein